MRRAQVVAAVVGLVGATLAGLAGTAQAVVPQGFSNQLVASVPAPTAFAFTPDGRMLITTQGGTVRVVENGALLAAPALDLSANICAGNTERGLLGIAVDPAFATPGTNFVYLYYSAKINPDCGSSTVNRVSRFSMTGNILSGEFKLIDNIPSTAGNHNAGDVQFGKDGLLYISVGDGGCDYPGTTTPSGCGGSNDAARDTHILLGKILRIDRNGNIPAGNPYQGSDSGRCNVAGRTDVGRQCQEAYASGLRNPFRMAFDTNAPGTRFYINDVGQGAWEEIDLGTAGADYGWNIREGHCATGSTTNCGPPPAGLTNPIFDYGRSDGCGSITGGAFVPRGLWPTAYQGRYLFADYNCGRIFRLDPATGGGFIRTDFATELGGLVHLGFGPWGNTQALYYTTYANGGEIRRIAYTAPGTFVSSTSGDAGQAVTASATGAAPGIAYSLRIGRTAATCGRTQFGPLATADANGNIGFTSGVIPDALTSGSYFICFARASNPAETTVATPFTVV